MIGALIYLQKPRISSDAAFSVLDWTAYVIFIVVIGGIGTIEGPILGVILIYLMQNYLAAFGTWYLILLGTLAIVVLLLAPKGIWGYLAGLQGLVLFPVRAAERPSHVADLHALDAKVAIRMNCVEHIMACKDLNVRSWRAP